MAAATIDRSALTVTVECEECGASGCYPVHADTDSTRHKCVECEAVVWAARPGRVEWTYRKDGRDFLLNTADYEVWKANPGDDEWEGPFQFSAKSFRKFERELQREGVRLD